MFDENGKLHAIVTINNFVNSGQKETTLKEAMEVLSKIVKDKYCDFTGFKYK